MSKTLRARLFQFGLLAASLALFWLTLRAVSLPAIWAVLRQLDIKSFLVLGAANAFVIATLSLRWRLFLGGQGYRVPFLRLMSYRLSAFGVSYFTPGPHFGGEPLQIYLVTARHGVPSSSSIAAVTLDKLFELLANFTFLLAGLIFLMNAQVLPSGLSQVGFPADTVETAAWARQGALYALPLFLLPASLLAALWLGYRPLSGLLTVVNAWRPSLRVQNWRETLRQSEDRAAYLCRSRPLLLAAAVLVSALGWAMLVGEYWLMTRLLGLNLTFGQAILALIAARLAILLPMPAGLGVLEASQALALSLLGMDPAAGVGLALLIRARDVLLGLFGLWLGGADVWRIFRQKEESLLEVHNAQKREMAPPDAPSPRHSPIV